ncbi:hypothetical protein K504DRAFT_460936 [Pleomassaria siparia CBS 279.74]|uniref:Uncharacterized protein n=1 Tax=Pleomassaria siparia CBS 279.74 TaxID=1314801 RepID=A0A6G1JWF5_9PLEO|nr:hypothetical protein K504DRAFT_460936 [Pleomassaria siparia CBS 279.74]
MFSRTFFSAVALESLIASAMAGNAILNNHCSYGVHVLSTLDNSQTFVPPGGNFVQGMAGGAGKSLKIARDPADFWAHGITQLEYTVTDTLWYDISYIDCVQGVNADDLSRCPGAEAGVMIEANGGQCAVGETAANAKQPNQAYYVWNDDWATKSCQAGQSAGDVTMTICTGSGLKKRVAGRIEY